MIRASWAGTAVFTVVAVAAAIHPDPLDVVSLVVSLALFAAGGVLFVWAYALAVRRSRRDEIAVAGVYLLSGSAPGRVRAHLLGSLAVEVAAALGTAAARPYSPLAFGVLVPLYGLGCCGVWAARHGTFPPRTPVGRPKSAAAKRASGRR